jgi:catechol 2,3-dioxygenase-like lactoylglutathione lyase family enzyme
MDPMPYDAIDFLFVAVPDLEAACRPYARLGLPPSLTRDGRRTLHVGGPAHRVAVHFLADPGRATPLAGPVREALASGRGLFAVGLRVPDLSGAVDLLASKGVVATTVADGGGGLAWLPLHDRTGTDLVLVGQAEAAHPDQPGHGFPLRRLDHLAAVTPDLEEKARFWGDTLGVPVSGAVLTATMIIRQLRIGDAVLELLGPASPDSPLRQRPPGLVSMASWEVLDLDASVRQARAAGFTVPDPAPGVLPGTRVATIPGPELAGVDLQLLQYV